MTINQFPPLPALPTNSIINEIRDRLAGMSDTQRKFWLAEVCDGYCRECGSDEICHCEDFERL